MNCSLLSSVFLMRAWNRQWLHYNINILKMSSFKSCSGLSNKLTPRVVHSRSVVNVAVSFTMTYYYQPIT